MILISSVISLSLIVGVICETSNIADEKSSYCPFQTECPCEDYDDGHDIWCPDKDHHALRLHYKPGRLWIVCNHEFVPHLANLIFLIRGLNVGSLESLVFKHCPVPDESFQVLIDALNATDLKALGVMFGSTEQGSPLVANQFLGLSSLIELEVQNVNADSGLMSIDSQAFNGLSELKSLSLTSNGISQLHEDVFKPLESLENLVLMDKNLEKLPEKLLQNQKNLKELKIKSDTINSFSKYFFSYVPSLTSLTFLSVNFKDVDGVPAFEPGIFDDLVSLTNVSITGRGFDLMPETIFGKNKRLARLEIAFHQCSTAGPPCNLTLPRVVMNSPSLQVFRLFRPTQTRISIPSDFFANCTGLQEVEISRAGLTSLPEDLFRKTTNLKKVDLFSNQIETIPDNLFSNTLKLKSLNLRQNKIKDIKLILNGLNRLVTLDLSSNQLTSLHQRAFQSNGNLETLDLSKNNISFDVHDQPTWRSLTKLHELNLAENNIKLNEIPYEWRTISLRLTLVNVSGNEIGPQLSIHDLEFQQDEITVDLSKNLIHRIVFDEDNGDNAPPEFRNEASHTSKPPIVLLGQNPIECNCHTYQLALNLRWKLPNGQKPKVNFRGQNLLCNSPPELKDFSIRNLTLDVFSCQFPSNELNAQCPDNCKCRYTPAVPAKVWMNCKGQNLVNYPSFLPKVKDASQICLDLSRNRMTSLAGLREYVSNYSGVNLLVLSNNNFSSVPVQDLPENVSKIYLDFNQIQVFDEETLQRFRKLDELKLGNNPYSCDCESKNLQEFIHENRRIVTDLQDVTLDCGGSQKANFIVGDIEDTEVFCTDVRKLAVSIALPIVILLLLALGVVIFVLVNKERILVFLYSHPTVRKLFPIDLEDEEKHYDAFISYAEPDAEFVANHLLPGLEDSNEIRYKCLVHVRDFVPGRSIAEQILDAVDKSRRTIIVLSKHFVTSDWARHEFDAAHARKKVIVVVYGDLPSQEEMGSTMWDYILTNTYVKHDDPWFWQKLRYALPHRGGWSGGRGFKFGRSVIRRRKDTDQMQLVNGTMSSSKDPNLRVVINADGVLERDTITSTPPPCATIQIPPNDNGFQSEHLHADRF